MTKSQPRVAVLFPCYNPGPELVATLASIRNQTVPNRLFLIDDGSAKKPDYASLLKGMDCHLIELPKNLGIVGAMNAGIDEILKGNFDFVARIDNGDENVLNRYEKQIAYLEAHPELSFIGCQMKANSVVTGFQDITIYFSEDPKECAAKLRYNVAAPHGGIMYRTSFLRAMKGYTDRYPAAEDYAMQLWAVKNGHAFANHPEFLYIGLETPNSISMLKRKKQVMSRIRAQIDYADWLNPNSYIGIARSAVTYTLPFTTVRKIKWYLGMSSEKQRA